MPGANEICSWHDLCCCRCRANTRKIMNLLPKDLRRYLKVSERSVRRKKTDRSAQIWGAPSGADNVLLLEPDIPTRYLWELK